MVTSFYLERCGRLGGGVLAGALLGALLAGISSMPLGARDELVVITVPVGFFAGGALGFLARVMPERRWLRRLALLIAGPLAVFFATLAWLIALEGSAGEFALMGAIVTTVFALPGTTLGAFVFEVFLRGEDPFTQLRIHTLLRRLGKNRSHAPLAVAALDDRTKEVRLAAARWMLPHVPDAPARIRAWSARAEPAFVPDIARALARSGSPGIAEEMLLDVVERGDWNVQGIAIRHLGDVGGLPALRALQALRDVGYHGSVVSFALEKIRRRLPQAERGLLSVALPADGAGHLSEPSAREGRLSEVQELPESSQRHRKLTSLS